MTEEELINERRRERALELALGYYENEQSTAIIDVAKEFEQFLKGENTK